MLEQVVTMEVLGMGRQEVSRLDEAAADSQLGIHIALGRGLAIVALGSVAALGHPPALFIA